MTLEIPPQYLTNPPSEVSSRRSLYLIGAMVQAEVQGAVRAFCVDSEAERLPEIISLWQAASAEYAAIVAAEPYSATSTRALDSSDSSIAGIAAQPLFRSSFAQLPISFASVDLDQLIAPQRSVNLGLVERLKEHLAEHCTDDDLVRFCLSTAEPTAVPAAMQQAQNLVVYSADSADFRFLGGYMKQVDAHDIAVAHGGGAPAAAIVLLVGYGAAAVNVLQYGDRFVLNNGFHRAYALKALGISTMPVVVQHVENWELEFPPQVAGLPREYLLHHRRPVLLKDFFNERLVTVLDEKPRRKMVKVQWGVDQIDVPV